MGRVPSARPLEDAGNQCCRHRRGGEGGAGEARREGREATNVVAAGEAERKVLAARREERGRNDGEAERTRGEEGIEGDGGLGSCRMGVVGRFREREATFTRHLPTHQRPTARPASALGSLAHDQA
jgi:hypothetical protein